MNTGFPMCSGAAVLTRGKAPQITRHCLCAISVNVSELKQQVMS